MTTNAFVNALRGPEGTPAEISPLSYLLAINGAMGDLEALIVQRDIDPDAYWLMGAELRTMYLKLKAALAEHDAQTGAPLVPKPVPGLELSAGAMEAVEKLRELDF